MHPNPEKPKILVVDADLDIRIYLCNLLIARGFEVVDAGSREDGLAKARSLRPDLIVLEALLPMEGGIQLYHFFRTDKRLKQVPVVMLSRLHPKTLSHYHAFRKDRGGRQIPGPDAFLNRPPEAEALLETVARLCPGADCPPPPTPANQQR